MFVRKIKSRKSTCFQIGEKVYGKFKLLQLPNNVPNNAQFYFPIDTKILSKGGDN